MKLPLIISLTALVSGSLAAIGSSCTSASGAGTCQYDASCTSGFNVVGACPNDPASVLCCIPKTCSTPYGAGVCRNTSKSCTGGSFVSGYCPGGSDVKCCVSTASSCTTTYGSGKCITDASCTDGFSVSGTCANEPSGVNCCIPKTCTTPSGSGICRNSSKACSGSYVSGYCPGDSTVKCCVQYPSGGTGDTISTLNALQSAHARTIAAVGKTYSVGNRGCKVAIATAMQESTIRVLANTNVPTSYNYYYEGVGSDHDSVGIFQQRPIYWGTVKDCMDPATSAGKFFAALKNVSGWQTMTIAQAAQAVQRSAYPDAYAKWETLATNVCAVVYP